MFESRLPVWSQVWLSSMSYLHASRATLTFGRKDFLSAYLIDQVFSFEIDEMRSLFIVGQICADPLRHYHDECAVIHVHPISSTDQFIRRVANEWTVGIDR